MSCNSRCLPDKALIVGAQLSVKGASPCPRLAAEQTDLPPLWAAGSGVRRPHCSHVQHRSTPASPHNPTSSLSARSDIPPTSSLLFIYTLGSRSGHCYSLNLRWSLCVWAWRTHPPSLSKTRYCHNWPVHQVSCWKSRFCTDVRPMALCNHVHTQPGFNYTLEGKTEGLSGFYFKVPFSGKIGSRGPNSDPPHTTGKTFGFNYSDGNLLIVLLRTLHSYPPL